jgi:hypothetical protein
VTVDLVNVWEELVGSLFPVVRPLLAILEKTVSGEAVYEVQGNLLSHGNICSTQECRQR